ncbi:MAG: NAD-dependent epimerase/dehydratase family protein [Bdellovibrionota bacterium]
MQALVTGGSGFIGSELIRQLNAKNIKVRALLRKTSPRGNLQGLDFETALGDLCDAASLKEVVKGIDVVFHVAGSISARSREEFFLHNATGTGNLAKACAEANPGLKRFVYVSSVAATGPALSLSPKRESDTALPISAYGESKLGGEKQLEAFAGIFPVTVVRPPAVYGPRDRGIFEFVKLVNSGVAPIFPAKNETREKYFSMIYVEDLVDGILLAGLAESQKRYEVFFLSDGQVHSWTQVMKTMADALGKRPLRLPLPRFVWLSIAAAYSVAGKVLKKQFPLTLDKLNELDPDYWIFSSDHAQSVLGFKPKWDLQRGMAHTVAWYRENGWV